MPGVPVGRAGSTLRWLVSLSVATTLGCGGGGQGSDQWVFEVMCSGFEERQTVRIPCGAGPGEACTAGEAEDLARQQVPPTCRDAIPTLTGQAFDCLGCP